MLTQRLALAAETAVLAAILTYLYHRRVEHEVDQLLAAARQPPSRLPSNPCPVCAELGVDQPGNGR